MSSSENFRHAPCGSFRLWFSNDENHTQGNDEQPE